MQVHTRLHNAVPAQGVSLNRQLQGIPPYTLNRQLSSSVIPTRSSSKQIFDLSRHDSKRRRLLTDRKNPSSDAAFLHTRTIPAR